MNRNSEIKIIFEDDWLVAVDKPGGIVVNNARTVREETVQEWFEKKFGIEDSDKMSVTDAEFYKKGGVIHRLDRETSGILLLAKIPIAYKAMKQLFMERKVHKMYSSLVHGIVEPVAGVISLPVIRHPKVWGKFTVGTDLSKTAITQWHREEVYCMPDVKQDRYSLLRLEPLTGRTHQLRVHLKHLGHPIVSDRIYLGKRELQKDLTWCPRLWLHASRLEFMHPKTGESVVFESKLPKELHEALGKLVH